MSGEWAHGPFRKEQLFRLPALGVASRDVTLKGSDLLDLQSGEIETGTTLLPCHPDVAADLSKLAHADVHETDLRFSPTGSGRTVVIYRDSVPVLQLKLHYPNKIGRFERDLYLYKWMASLERSRLFSEAYDERNEDWSYYEEATGHFLDSGLHKGFGNIIRPLFPRGLSVAEFKFVPGFSLFAKPVYGKHSVFSALQTHFAWTEEIAVKKILISLIELYFNLALRYGLMPELNAQNVVFAFSNDGRRVVPCIRDMQDVYVDQSFAKSDNFLTYKYLSADDADLEKRRSFSFDFKLCEYFLVPMAREIARHSRCPDARFNEIVDFLRQTVRNCLSTQGDYFGDTSMYAYSKSADASAIGFVTHSSARLRS
ncbi:MULTISPECIES: hypothetical protein [unclassified Ruegeria]|uniref:hypothetical protein n=1 Tax=unclassified Ruegeria TaxID=2625375 RepID=UPI0014919182|nr:MULTISPECIES: hypothetical protein [unclassified Ruegeria]NOD85910.1 hypothetical protein [Ruegeria sp. HKCCD6119]